MTNVAQKAGSLKEDVAQKPGSLKEEVAQKAGSLKEDVAKNRVAAISAIAVVGLIVAGGSYMLWKRHASSVGTAQEQSQQQGPIAAVESLINRLRGRDMPEGIYKTNGRNEATEVDVAAKYPGRLATETVDEGDEVTAGQVVATISSPETEAQLRNAQAQLLKAKQDVAVAVATVAQRKSDVDFTSSDYDRGEKLIKAGWRPVHVHGLGDRGAVRPRLVRCRSPPDHRARHRRPDPERLRRLPRDRGAPEVGRPHPLAGGALPVPREG